jgi:hypothetical protein
MLCINLTLYIVTGMSYFNGNTKMAIIYGVVAILFTLLTFNFYQNKKKRYQKKKKKKDEESGSNSCDCVSPDVGDCFRFGFDMDKRDGADCIDIECGNFEIFECDCGGADCGGCS